jgi:hypothetical protein
MAMVDLVLLQTLQGVVASVMVALAVIPTVVDQGEEVAHLLQGVVIMP